MRQRIDKSPEMIPMIPRFFDQVFVPDHDRASKYLVIKMASSVFLSSRMATPKSRNSEVTRTATLW